jgi:hypothetical protein
MYGGFKLLFERLESFRLRTNSKQTNFMPYALLPGLERVDIDFDGVNHQSTCFKSRCFSAVSEE